MSVEEAVGVWSVAEIAEWLGARVEGDAAARFVAATTDSRDSREGTAFFALDGAKHRGSEFVPDAFGSGCSVVVVPEDWTGRPVTRAFTPAVVVDGAGGAGATSRRRSPSPPPR